MEAAMIALSSIAAMETSSAGRTLSARGFAAAMTETGDMVWQKHATNCYVKIVAAGSRFDVALYQYDNDDPLDVGLVDDADVAADWCDEALASVSEGEHAR
jgi:hypothetical protein